MTAATRAARIAASRAALIAATISLLACDGSGTPLDAGRDAPRAPDAGFDPSSLAPCTADPATAIDGTPFAAYVAPAGASAIEARAFSPFVILEADGRLGELDGVTSMRRDALRMAAACAGDAACVRAQLAWSEADADAAADALSARLVLLDAVTAIASPLRASGVCALFDTDDDAALVRVCIRDGLLQATAALDVLDELDAAMIDIVVDAIALDTDSLAFWMPATRAATQLLLAAGRDEGARYEPLALGENAAAIARVGAIDFARYAFAAIVVPGQGPTNPDTALNPAGRARADAGFERWSAGLAPFVLLSGGHVHPDRTRYSEAIEMKRHLVETRGMPADAILVDPYARHTTTNLRNATRILVRAGVPADRPILVTSDLFQAGYIRSLAFETRNRDELGYVPYQQLEELSAVDSCFLPVAQSLHVDARDPLDP